VVKRKTSAPAPEFERTTRRHRHPQSPRIKCGAALIVLEDGRYQQRGKVRRTCMHCHKRIAKRDVV
jgi:hypothetical protein